MRQELQSHALFVQVKNNEVFLKNAYIKPYEKNGTITKIKKLHDIFVVNKDSEYKDKTITKNILIIFLSNICSVMFVRVATLAQ